MIRCALVGVAAFVFVIAAPASAQDLAGGLVVVVPPDVHLTQQVESAKVGMSRPALATMLAGQAFDATSTFIARRNPNLREANPLGLVGVMAVKAGMAVGVPWLFRRIGVPRRQSDAMAYALGGIGAAAGAWNAHQIRKVVDR